MFQSLFQWMSFFNLKRLSIHGFNSACFNPCFSGCLSSIAKAKFVDTETVKFQSLFQWMSFFNTLTKDDRIALAKFQSLFQWMSFFNQKFPVCMLTLFLFQSLFQWMSFFNYRRVFRTLRHYESFNPCFSGCLSSIALTKIKTDIVWMFQSLFQWMSFFNFDLG